MRLPKSQINQLCRRLRNGEVECLDGYHVKLGKVTIQMNFFSCTQCDFNELDVPNIHAVCFAADPGDKHWSTIMVPVPTDEVQPIKNLTDNCNQD